MNHEGPAFSDYIVFVDESGDHGLDNVDPNYPMFVLAFCVFEKRAYIDEIVPAIQRFKMKHFGHDQVVLHEKEIRKDIGPFSILRSRDTKAAFIGELTEILREADFGLICSVISKIAFKARYAAPENPYHVALGFGLERVHYYLQNRTRTPATTHIVVECRGKREDAELELEFRRICDGANYNREQLPLSLVFAGKRTNSIGLQLADLVARPVGMSILRADQTNRAFEVLEPKFYTSPTGRRQGWGLKVFP